MGVIRPEVIATQQRSGTFLDYLAQANKSISELGNYLQNQKALNIQQQQANEIERSNHYRDTLKIIQEMGKNSPGGTAEVLMTSPTLAKSLLTNLGFSPEETQKALQDIQTQQLDVGSLLQIGISNYDDALKTTNDPIKAFDNSKKAVQTNFLQQTNRSISSKDFYTPKQQPTTIRTPQKTYTEAELETKPIQPIKQTAFKTPKVSNLTDAEIKAGTEAQKEITQQMLKDRTEGTNKPLTVEEYRQQFIKKLIANNPNINTKRASEIYNTLIANQANQITQTTPAPLTTEAQQQLPGNLTQFSNVPTNGQMSSQLPEGPVQPQVQYPQPTTGSTQPTSNVAPAQPVKPPTNAQPAPQSSSTSLPSSPPSSAQQIINQTTSPEFGLEQTQVPVNVFENLDITKEPEKDQKDLLRIKDWFSNPNDKQATYKGKIAASKQIKAMSGADVRTRLKKDARKLIDNLGGLKAAIEYSNVPYGQLQLAKKSAEELAKYRAATLWFNTHNGGKGSTAMSQELRDGLKAYNSNLLAISKMTDPDQRNKAIDALFNPTNPSMIIVSKYLEAQGIKMSDIRDSLKSEKKVRFISRLIQKILGTGETNTPTTKVAQPTTAADEYIKNAGLLGQ